MTSADFTAYGLHWVRATMPYRLLMENVLPSGLVFQKEVEFLGYGHYNYNRHWKTPCGNIYWHTEDPRQKILLDITGEQCEEMTRRGLDHLELLVHIHTLGGRVGRLDFAADYHGQSSPDDVWWDYLVGNLKTAARKPPRQKDKGVDITDGYTLEIGNRESARFVRIYDRVAKLKAAGAIFDKPEIWTRVEMEVKEGQAPALARAMREYGIVSAGKKALRAYIKETSVEWLKTLLEGDYGVYIAPVGRKETDTYKWLVETCLPTLSQELYRCEHIDGLKLIDKVESIIHKHKNRIKKEIRQHMKMGSMGKHVPNDSKWQ